MSSIIPTFITTAARVLNRLSDTMEQQQAEWFTNRSGNSSFRAEAVEDNGSFNAVISRRTGFNSYQWQYQQCASAGRFSSAPQAIKAGRKMAQQLAQLRYRFD